MPYCPKCGKEVQDDADFCISCGAQIKIVTSEKGDFRATLGKDLAGLGSRIVAGLIDFIILFVIAGIIFSVLFAGSWAGFMAGMPWRGFNWGWFGGMFGSQFLLWLVYYTYFEGSSGQTLGKKVINIKVVKSDGSKCEYGSALIRTILRIIDNLPFLYILGIILIAATDKQQRLGDMLANTIVVKS